MLPIGRLGLRELVHDELGTWVEESKPGEWQASVGDYVLFLGLPVAVGLTAWWLGVRMWSVDAFLAGTSILTALLFGLLVHVLSLGLEVSRDERYGPTSRLTLLVDDLRANVSWTCFIGLVISGALAVAGTFTRDLDHVGTHPWASGLVLGLGLHLVLSLLMVLKRVRSAHEQMRR